MEQPRISIFQRPAWVVVFALTAAIAWGWAFPLIKIGFSAFGITADMTGSKMLFAGIRFAAAGLIVLSVARGSGRSFKTDIRHISSSMSACRIAKGRGRLSSIRSAPSL